jgi:hypothetical protein
VNNQSLSLIIYAHNAERALAARVHEAIRLLPPLFAECEVIVVDDGSSDATSSLAARLAADNDLVSVLRRRRRLGVAAALRHGLTAAHGDLVAIVSAEQPLAPLVQLAAHSEGRVAVLGFPDAPHPAPLDRLAAAIFGVAVRGVAGGIVLAERSALRTMPLVSGGPAVQSEIFIRATLAGQPTLAVSTTLPVRAPTPADLGDLLRFRAALGREQPANLPANWRRKALFGGALALIVGGLWALARRR